MWEVWSRAAQTVARCSRRRSESSSAAAADGSAAQLCHSWRLQPASATAHHRLPRGLIGQTGPPPPAFRRTGQLGLGGGGSAQVNRSADSASDCSITEV